MTEDKTEADPPSRLERSPTDRRSGVERRSRPAPWQGVERRKSNRRHAADRRGLQFGLFYKTRQPLGELYDWLEENCKGKWSVGLEEGGSATDRRSVKVLFENEKDKALFMDAVVRRG